MNLKIDDLIDDFETDADFIEIIDTDTLKNDALNQGYAMYLGDRIKLSKPEMVQLKDIIDEVINPNKPISSSAKQFDVTDPIQDIKIPQDHEKLKNIAVNIEEINGRILVKVGPCDLSGAGGHHVREQIIKNLVNQALSDAKINATYETVNVSACVGVRGRLQMIAGAFIDNSNEAGGHMNAYIKTDQEQTLTHWEPRKGPQSFFNDTICAMVTSACTSLFEKGIRDQSILSSTAATQEILKSDKLKDVFDHILSTVNDRITNLVNAVKEMVVNEPQASMKNAIQKMKEESSKPEIDPENNISLTK